MGRKIGLNYKTETYPAYNTFRGNGHRAYYGYLSLTRKSTNVIVGEITPENTITTKFSFTPFELARLKSLLKNFNCSTLEWNKKTELEGEL